MSQSGSSSNLPNSGPRPDAPTSGREPTGYGGEHVQFRACELVKIHDPREQTGTISGRPTRTARVGTFGGGVKEIHLSAVERST